MFSEELHEKARLALLLHDTRLAGTTLEQLYERDPHDAKTIRLLFQYHALQSDIEGMRQLWLKVSNKGEKIPSEILEEISWTIIRMSAKAPHPRIRAEALFAAAGTQDARGMQVLHAFLFDQNESVQELALQVATAYPDAPIQERASELLQKASPGVKLAAARLFVAQKSARAKDVLEALLTDESLSEDDQVEVSFLLAQQADSLDPELFSKALRDRRPNVRMLAASYALQHPSTAAITMVVSLLSDPSAGVRIRAMEAVGVWQKFLSVEDMNRMVVAGRTHIQSSQKDAITAAWLLCTCEDPQIRKEGSEALLSFLKGSPERMRMACSLIIKLGAQGVPLAYQALSCTHDNICRLNLAAFLLRHRQYVHEAACILRQTLVGYTTLLEMESENSMFVRPSQGFHHPTIPRLPESQDLFVRLQLTALQCYAGEKIEKKDIEKIMGDRAWGATVFAAGFLFAEFSSSLEEVLTPLLSHETETVRVQAALLLATVGKSKSAAKILWEQYEIASKEGKEALLLGFGALPFEQVSEKIAPVLFDPSPVLRTRAAGALLASLYH
jgi:HEAT repeat protein